MVWDILIPGLTLIVGLILGFLGGAYYLRKQAKNMQMDSKQLQNMARSMGMNLNQKQLKQMERSMQNTNQKKKKKKKKR